MDERKGTQEDSAPDAMDRLPLLPYCQEIRHTIAVRRWMNGIGA